MGRLDPKSSAFDAMCAVAAYNNAEERTHEEIVAWFKKAISIAVERA